MDSCRDSARYLTNGVPHAGYQIVTVILFLLMIVSPIGTGCMTGRNKQEY
jgi:hypothetical protein